MRRQSLTSPMSSLDAFSTWCSSYRSVFFEIAATFFLQASPFLCRVACSLLTFLQFLANLVPPLLPLLYRPGLFPSLSFLPIILCYNRALHCTKMCWPLKMEITQFSFSNHKSCGKIKFAWRIWFQIKLNFITFYSRTLLWPGALEDPIFAVNPPKLVGLYWDEHDNIFFSIK